MINQTYELNMTPGAVWPVVHVSQFDSSTRMLRFVLYDGADLFTGGGEVELRGRTPSGDAFYADCNYGSSVASVTVTREMTYEEGRCICELRLISGGKHIGSANFILEVEKAPE